MDDNAIQAQVLLRQRLARICRQLCGEQWSCELSEDVRLFRFDLWWNGVLVGMHAERFATDQALLNGFHIVGTRVEDTDTAAQFVAQHNQRARIGRFELAGDDVVFTHQLFSSSVNKASVRWLLRLLADSSRFYPELAETAGALRLTDLAAIADVEDD